MNISLIDEYGDDIMQAIDGLQNAEYQDGPFENILDGFDASRYFVEDLKQEMETFLSMGAPE